MKRILFLLFALISTLILISCGDAIVPNENDESKRESESLSDTEAPRVGELTLAGDNLQVMIGTRESMTIKGIRQGWELWLFLPAEAEVEHADLVVFNEKGEQSERMTVNLAECSMTMTASDGTKLSVRWLQSSLRGLFITLDGGADAFAAVEASADKSESATGKLSISDLTLDEVDISIHGRGNWTWTQDKKGYALKFSEKQSLLGMAKARRWVLLANRSDSSLMRNTLAYSLADQVGLPYTPENVPCELYVNGEYRGSYLVAEKTEIGKNRIEISELEKENEALNGNGSYPTSEETLDCGAVIRYAQGVQSPEDVSGGYLVEFELADRYLAEPCGFQTKRGFYFVIKSPEYASREQVTYLATLYQRTEDAIFENDPTLWKLLDMETAVKKYLIEELSKNFDANHSSQFSYKDAGDGPIYLGPVWDMDAAFGNTEATADPNGRYAATDGWWQGLRAREDFTAEAARIWEEELRPLCLALINEGITSYERELAPSAAMNFTRWEHLGVKPPMSTYISTGDSYEASVKQLRNYLEARVAWMDDFVNCK